MLYSLITGFTDRVVTKLSKGHEESISHFRNAEIEFLKGIRTFIDEEIGFLDRWLEKQQKSAEES
ncbi:MAG: hypothetical protein O7E52_02550 [Candidatus Poribacteria bacterium]|nr:hypothetical protein [Candidatus Poribacteria bacterium]